MLQVTFVIGYAPYNAGETAGFDNDTAQRLVAEGVAVPSGWSATPGPDAASLAAFEAGSAPVEGEVQADHLAGTVGAPGEVVGGQ
jgi:hypothetical protein